MEERLLRYNEIKAEIDKLKWKIAKKEREEVQASSPTLEVTGIKAQGFKSSSVENQVVRNVDEINMYKKQIEELEAEIRMIDSMINTLKGVERQVIELRYKQQLKWEGIAVTISRDVSRAKAIKEIAIAKLDKIYNK